MRRVASYGGDLGVPASQRLKLRLSSTAGIHLLGVPEDGASHILHSTSRAARNFRPEPRRPPISRAGSEQLNRFLAENDSHAFDEDGTSRIENLSWVENDTLQVDRTRQLTPAIDSEIVHPIDDDQTSVETTEGLESSEELRVPQDVDGSGILHVERAAVKIQTGYRRFRARRLFLAEKQKRITSAAKIQLWLRARVMRRRFLLQKRAACLIQAHTRGFLLRRVVDRWGAAACMIQRAWRTHRARENFLLQKNAAELIQTHARGFLTRRVLSRWRASARLIQRAWRSHRASELQNKLQLEKNAASLIQAHFRGFVMRRVASASRIQRAWRLHRADELLRKRNLMEKNAAELIQAHARGFFIRRVVNRWRAAASSIQNSWRSSQARRFREHSAACIIQRAWRSHRELNRAPVQQSEDVFSEEPNRVAEDWNSYEVDRVGDCLDTCLAGIHLRAAAAASASSGLDLPELRDQTPSDEACGYRGSLKEWKLQQLARVFLLQHQIAIQQHRAKLAPPFPPLQQLENSSKLKASGEDSGFKAFESREEQSGDIVLDIQLLLEEVKRRGFSSPTSCSSSSSSVLFMEIESCEKQAALAGLKQINTLLVVFVAVVIYTRSLCHGVLLWAKQSASKK